MILRIILIVIFLILSALFSGSEIVYSMVNTHRLSREASDGNKRAKKALDIAENFPETITTVLIGNNFVNIAMSAVATALALSIAKDTNLTEFQISLIETIAVTFTVLIFGEIMPKTIFQSFSYSASKKLTWYIKINKIIFFPFVFIFEKLASLMTLIFKNYAPKEEDISLDTPDELINMTNELEETGKIDNDDAELIKSAIDFTETSAWEIMVPRVDVIAYDINDGFDKIIEDDKFYENSRVILYKESIDNVIGIINTLKVLKYRLTKTDFTLNDFLYEPLYVHKTMPVANVLKELRSSHKHLAIVLDEWGGTYGILTIEDILEELFGEIWDETDVIENDYELIENDTYLIYADMNIDDFFDLIDYDDKDFETEYSTVGGLATELLDKLPSIGDQFDFAGYHFEIKDATETHVDSIIVKKLPTEDE